MKFGQMSNERLVVYLLKKYPKFSRDEILSIINDYGPSREKVEKAISFITPNNL